MKNITPLAYMMSLADKNDIDYSSWNLPYMNELYSGSLENKNLENKILKSFYKRLEYELGYPFNIPNKKEVMSVHESKNVVKLNEAQLRKVVAESVKRILKENTDIKSIISQLDEALNQAVDILSNFGNTIPQEQSKEFMRLIGKEWNDLWEAISAMDETLIHLNGSRGISQGDLTFDDLS